MKKEELEAFAQSTAKHIKTEDDLKKFSRLLTKITVEATLNAELEEHLGYAKSIISLSTNSRNGYSRKQLRTEAG